MAHLSKPVDVFVGIGSNLEAPEQQVRAAFEALTVLPHTCLVSSSSLYRTAPVGYEGQPDYVNAVARLTTSLNPLRLLEHLLATEQRFGRLRLFPNAPRILDLDVLLYDQLVCREPGLTVPHPRMHERAFVLLPLLEIAPEAVIPGCGAAKDLLGSCAGQKVERLPEPAFV